MFVYKHLPDAAKEPRYFQGGQGLSALLTFALHRALQSRAGIQPTPDVTIRFGSQRKQVRANNSGGVWDNNTYTFSSGDRQRAIVASCETQLEGQPESAKETPQGKCLCTQSENEWIRESTFGIVIVGDGKRCDGWGWSLCVRVKHSTEPQNRNISYHTLPPWFIKAFDASGL